MQDDYRIARPVFVWILITQAFLLLPHMLKFPLLLVPGWLFFTFWRVMVFRGRWNYPSPWLKAVTVVAVLLVVSASQARFFAIETMVILLLLAFLLKLVETATERDLLVSVYLAYFVIVTWLLFDQGVLSAVYMVIALLLVTATLIASYASGEAGFWQPMKEAGRLLLFSIPVMVVAFLVFPRLEPLWVLPQPSSSGKTGISDTMSPGMFSKLAETDELAFRVEFDDRTPPLRALYWRGLVLSRFDGRTWRQSDFRQRVKDIRAYYRINEENKPYRYRLIMEPSERHWMFVLSGTLEDDADSHYYDDFTLQQGRQIDSRQSWQLVSWPQSQRLLHDNSIQRQASLQLPDGFNPQTLALADQLRAAADSDLDYLQRVLDFFKDNNFVYTLEPPLLGRHSVDDFLFGSRQGFCEHYASAFTVLARAGGVPARVVTGYQGGDINPYEQHVTVRQLDAHAWVEVWLQDKGWIRMDPTYAVAPQRIDRGGQAALADQPGYLSESPFSPVRFNRFGWVKKLQYRLDQLNYLWHSQILSYQGRKQQEMLRRLLGELSLKKLALFVSGAFVVTALSLWLLLYLKYRPPARSKAEKLLQRLLRKMQKAGLQKQAGQGVVDFCRQCAQEYPAWASQFEKIANQYMQLRYADLSPAKKHRLMRQMRQNINRLHVK